MARIHHMTQKQAERAGLKIEEAMPGKFIAVRYDNGTVGDGPYDCPKEALRLAKENYDNPEYWTAHPDAVVDNKLPPITTKSAIPEHEMTDEEWENEMELTRSIDVEDAALEDSDREAEIAANKSGQMPMDKYREYRSNPNGPGCGDELDVNMRAATTGPDGKMSREQVQIIAEANDVWVPTYANLNSGMLRMTVTNRLRGFLRANPGHDVTLIMDGKSISGRFGIEGNSKSAARFRKSNKG